MLKKDGIRAHVIVSFRQLSELLVEWKSFGIWVIVWPLDTHAEHEDIKAVALAAKQHMQSGGKIVTAWPPLTIQNRVKWMILSKLLKILDESLLACGGFKQMAVTSSNRIEGAKFPLRNGVRKMVPNTISRMSEP